MKKQLKENRKPVNIVLLGLVSMFIDMSTEMVYPLVPLLLVSLGTTPVIIGVIEGITEGLSTVLKAFAGYVADKTKRKKPLAIIGYSAAFFYKLGIIFSATWVGVFISKIVDRIGKGLRTAPRDGLIADCGGKKLGGKFGLHKMFDMLGSALGVLIAFLILSYVSESSYNTVFYWSLVPAVIGVAVLCFVKENKRDKGLQNVKQEVYQEENAEQSTVCEIIERRNNGGNERLKLRDVRLSKKLWLYLFFLFVFSVGNSSNAFLLLKAEASGVSTTNVLLFYFLFNVVASAFSIPCGKLSDRVGKKNMIVIAYLIYAVTYLCFGFVTNTAGIAVLFAVYGFYQAFITGAEKSLAVSLAPKGLKSTVLGLQGTAQGLGLFISSLIAGVLWKYVDSSYAFLFGAGMAFVAAVAMFFVLGMRDKHRENDTYFA